MCPGAWVTQRHARCHHGGLGRDATGQNTGHLAGLDAHRVAKVRALQVCNAQRCRGRPHALAHHAPTGTPESTPRLPRGVPEWAASTPPCRHAAARPGGKRGWCGTSARCTLCSIWRTSMPASCKGVSKVKLQPMRKVTRSGCSCHSGRASLTSTSWPSRQTRYSGISVRTSAPLRPAACGGRRLRSRRAPGRGLGLRWA